MACVLIPDSSETFDYTAKAGAQVTVKVAANGVAKFSGATQNGDAIPIQNQDTVTFTVKNGVNLLEFVVNVADPNDIVQILEDCGGGQTQTVERFPNDPSDPVTGFSVFGA